MARRSISDKKVLKAFFQSEKNAKQFSCQDTYAIGSEAEKACSFGVKAMFNHFKGALGRVFRRNQRWINKHEPELRGSQISSKPPISRTMMPEMDFDELMGED